MTSPFTYSGDPSTSLRDATRFYVGDTDAKRPLLNDNEVDYALSQYPAPAGAAVLLLNQLATRFSREADFSAGAVSKSFSQIATAYKTRADDLRAANARAALPFFGGLTFSGKRDLANDLDSIQPHFRMAMWDDPMALQFDQVYPLLSRLGWWNG